MPWMETSPVEQRERFIGDHRLELYAMAELCARYGISRKTGYKWLARFDEGGRLRIAIVGAQRSRLRSFARPTHRLKCWRNTRYCAGSSRRRHSSSPLVTSNGPAALP